MVEADELLGPQRVAAGDAVIAMASSGLHSNGYSLARRVLLDEEGPGLDATPAHLGRTIGEELLEPTRIYTADCLALARSEVPVHAFSHITGGGLAANLARVLPPGLAVDIDRATWRPQPIFDLIASLGAVPAAEMEKTFNMGIGMVAIVPAAAAEAALALLQSRGVGAWVAGSVRAAHPGEAGDADAKGGSGGVARVVGVHPEHR